MEAPASPTEDNSVDAVDMQQEHDTGSDRWLPQDGSTEMEGTPDSEPQFDVQAAPDQIPEQSVAVGGRPQRMCRRPAYLEDYDG